MGDLGPEEPTASAAAGQSTPQELSSDPRPPKQRFKESAHGEQAASPSQQDQQPQQRDKRPLSAVLDDAESEIIAAARSNSDSGGSPSPPSPAGSGDLPGLSQQKEAKQPRQQASLIRNVARPHKPRIGPEYQAVLPPFNPNHPRTQP